MTFYNNFSAACAALFLSLSPFVFGQSISIESDVENKRSITIMREQKQDAMRIRIDSIYQWDRPLSLKRPIDPRFLPTEELIALVESFAMVTDLNIAITRQNYDIDTQHQLVIGFAGGTSDIVDVKKLPDGWQITGSFKDLQTGQFISPPQSSLAVYNTKGQKLCIEEMHEVDIKMSVMILIDRSGSMEAVMPQARDILKKTLTQYLPDTAYCAVASFADSWRYHQKSFQSCRDPFDGLDTIEAGGGTFFLNVMGDAYRTFSAPVFDDHQKVMIMITDGIPSTDQEQSDIDALLAQKKDVHTFIYHIGAAEEKRFLEAMADHYLDPDHDVMAQLASYLELIGDGYKKQKVVKASHCSSPAQQAFGNGGQP